MEWQICHFHFGILNLEYNFFFFYPKLLKLQLPRPLSLRERWNGFLWDWQLVAMQAIGKKTCFWTLTSNEIYSYGLSLTFMQMT